MDWHDLSQYPDPADTSLHRWAWEFLFRNPVFHAEFHAAIQAERALKIGGELPWNKLPGGVLWKWGIRSMPCAWPEFEAASTPFRFDVPPWYVARDRAEPSRSDRFVLEFDLTAPIEPQIKRAGRWLIANQNDRFPKAKRNRNQPDKLRDYLRVLDGAAAGATTREMVKAFSEEGRSKIDERLLRTWKQRAAELRDGGYRQLLAL